MRKERGRRNARPAGVGQASGHLVHTRPSRITRRKRNRVKEGMAPPLLVRVTLAPAMVFQSHRIPHPAVAHPTPAATSRRSLRSLHLHRHLHSPTKSLLRNPSNLYIQMQHQLQANHRILNCIASHSEEPAQPSATQHPTPNQTRSSPCPTWESQP